MLTPKDNDFQKGFRKLLEGIRIEISVDKEGGRVETLKESKMTYTAKCLWNIINKNSQKRVPKINQCSDLNYFIIKENNLIQNAGFNSYIIFFKVRNIKTKC